LRISSGKCGSAVQFLRERQIQGAYELREYTTRLGRISKEKERRPGEGRRSS
jgi:hypothetical protein